MTNWLRINGGSWMFTDSFIIGSGSGFGDLSTSYSIDQAGGVFLNGKISARINIRNRAAAGAGIIGRADNYGTFLTLHVAPDGETGDHISLRLSVFRNYEIVPIVSLKERVLLDKGYNLFELECISGQINGYLKTTGNTYKISYCIPHLPLPGYAGLMRLFNADISVREFKIEKYTFKSQGGQTKMQTYKYDVFISHSSGDKELIKKITTEFNSNGISYWIDSEKILYGDSVVQKIESGLKESKYVLVALSKNLGRSNWCRAEYGPLLNKECGNNSNTRVIPLKLDDCTDDEIPLLLYDKRRADYNNMEDFRNLMSFLKM